MQSSNKALLTAGIRALREHSLLVADLSDFDRRFQCSHDNFGGRRKRIDLGYMRCGIKFGSQEPHLPDHLISLHYQSLRKQMNASHRYLLGTLISNRQR